MYSTFIVGHFVNINMAHDCTWKLQGIGKEHCNSPLGHCGSCMEKWHYPCT